MERIVSSSITSCHTPYTIDNYQKEKTSNTKEIGRFVGILLPSIGHLKGYSFKGNYQYVKFWVFLKLLESYFGENYKEYYCDISQGLNVYADAFKEAFRNLVVFDGLYNFGKKGIKVFLLYSDPIFRRSGRTSDL